MAVRYLGNSLIFINWRFLPHTSLLFPILLQNLRPSLSLPQVMHQHQRNCPVRFLCVTLDIAAKSLQLHKQFEELQILIHKRETFGSVFTRWLIAVIELTQIQSSSRKHPFFLPVALWEGHWRNIMTSARPAVPLLVKAQKSLSSASTAR